MMYPLLAGKNARYVDTQYVSTDSATIKAIAKQEGAHIIERPQHLCSKEALGEDAFQHAYFHLKKNTSEEIEFIVLLFCNSPTILSKTIDEGIEILRCNPNYDSAVTVSKYNMWSPLRARRENCNGLLDPFVPFSNFGDEKTLNCDRDSQGDVWFADMGVSIVRPHCLENMSDGLLPQRWMGRKIFPLKQWGGCDVDYEWQIPLVEYWLKKEGFSEDKTPYDLD
jgi:hypothetical protein